MNIYLVRHGETDFNKDFIYQGFENDCELNEKGIYQAKVTGNYFKKYRPKIDIIFSSPMKRTINTAEIIGNILNITNIKLDHKICQLRKGNKAGRLVSKEYDHEKKYYYNNQVMALI